MTRTRESSLGVPVVGRVVQLAAVLGVPIEVFGQRLVGPRRRKGHDRKMQQRADDMRHAATERMTCQHKRLAVGEAGDDDVAD
eukprot:3935102-Rhodomonas_salina.2